MSTLAERLAGVVPNMRLSEGPLWLGPSSQEEQGGITQSIIGRWLVCRERARVHLMEGLRPIDRFSSRMGYGGMFHLCLEWHDRVCSDGSDRATDVALGKLEEHVEELLKRHPTQQEEVVKWYEVCRVQFPLYLQFWATRGGQAGSTSIMQEQVFDVPYRLPSGRTARLRGKWDGVDLAGGGLWLVERKTKSEIDEEKITRQLSFDLQTMTYLVALVESQKAERDLYPGGVTSDKWGSEDFEDERDAVTSEALLEWGIKGVHYDVIRRPLSGGKGTIVQRQPRPPVTCPNCSGTGRTPKRGQTCSKCRGIGRSTGSPAETDAEFYGRLAKYVEDEPSTYFARWNSEVSGADVERFRRTCLDPILECVLDDHEWWQWCLSEGSHHGDPADRFDQFSGEVRRVHFPHHCPRHFVMPFGTYNPITEGGQTDLDDHLRTGGTVGLVRVDDLFPELR